MWVTAEGRTVYRYQFTPNPDVIQTRTGMSPRFSALVFRARLPAMMVSSVRRSRVIMKTVTGEVVVTVALAVMEVVVVMVILVIVVIVVLVVG